MALRPVDNESFYREVDEELRRDQMKTYWERFGKLVIAGVVLLLALIGGYIWWQNQKEVKAGEQSAILIDALDDVGAGRKAAGTAKLDGLIKSGSAGHRAAALLTKADLAIGADDLKGAAAIYKQVADDDGLAQPYRDLALVRMTAVELDTLAPQAVIDRLKGLAVAGNPWFGSAGEMVALSYLKLGKPKQAAGIFAAMAKDKKLPDTLRSRATQMAGSLGVDAVQEAADATQEGTQ
ncbi:MAG TPA: tetratricopeptide repeat protein [Allosphingosinicella sp.]|nr:tetratricopeptide repeat protein [Allosphingosinicella sp.]